MIILKYQRHFLQYRLFRNGPWEGVGMSKQKSNSTNIFQTNSRWKLRNFILVALTV